MLKVQCQVCHAFIARIIPLTFTHGGHLDFRVEAKCPNRKCKNHKSPNFSQQNFTITDEGNLQKIAAKADRVK